MAATTVRAQDKSQYTLFNPTPTDQMRPFSTDRPTKSHEYIFLLAKSGETLLWYHKRKKIW